MIYAAKGSNGTSKTLLKSILCRYFIIQVTFYLYMTFSHVDITITITFNQSTYNVNEDDGPAQPVLVLSNPSSTNITVQVRDTQNTATSE